MAAWFPIGAGLFTIICSVMNARFFMQHRKAQGMVRMIGETGTRVFYVLLGLFLVGIGVAVLVGAIQ